jgi:hypothetical protein
LPSIAYRRPTTAIWTAVIWFRVSVPVLSELIAEVEPRVSVDCNRFMIAPALASACVPEARIVVTTAGRFSGMAPMAKATAAVKTTVNVSPRTPAAGAPVEVVICPPRGFPAGRRQMARLRRARSADHCSRSPPLSETDRFPILRGPLLGCVTLPGVNSRPFLSAFQALQK